ncbi:aminoacyl-tRNA hydrolase [bacterium]|nr:MAG: aminoacyl-tRNA hydrolase [bacterium]
MYVDTTELNFKPLPEFPFLLVGLGNPGREYRGNRHNVGFMTIDRLSEAFGIKIGKVQAKALIGIGPWEGRKVILAKPQTYMNLSGDSVGSLLRYYKVPLTQLIVAHDDLDLPVGTLRLRPGGGSAGQKGIASTINKVGTQNFPRLRIGIGRPPGQMVAADYVLQDFSKADQEIMAPTLDRAVDAIKLFVREGLDAAMNQFNGSLQ